MDYVLLGAMVLPSVTWAVLDQGLWQYEDMTFVAVNATRLYYAALLDSVDWWDEMLWTVPLIKPPMLHWLGQVFFPVGLALGNANAGLLLLVQLAHLGALVLLYEALRACDLGRKLALLGALAAAASPQFIQVSKQFHTQSLQLFVVAWFIYIAVRSMDWDSVTTTLQLVASSAFAMALQFSTPVLCVVPGAFALLQAIRKRREALKSVSIRHGPLLLLAIALAVTVSLWYARNFWGAWEYARQGYEFAENRAPNAGYFEKILFYLNYLKNGLAYRLLTPLFIPVLAWALVESGGRAWRTARQSRIVAWIALGAILCVLVVYATATVAPGRYMLPLVGYFAFLVGWSFNSVSKPLFVRSVAMVFVAQLAVFQLQDLTGFPEIARIGLDYWRPIERNPSGDLAVMEQIYQLSTRANAVVLGQPIPFGVWDVEYHASKKLDYWNRYFEAGSTSLKMRRWERERRLIRLADRLYGPVADKEKTWEWLTSQRGGFLIMADPERRTSARRWRAENPDTEANSSEEVAAELTDRAASSELFERISRPEYPGFEIYRIVGSR
jgi:hypothetical protein